MWKELLTKSFWTSFFGAVAGVPAIVLGVFTPGTSMALSAQWTHIIIVTGGIGLVGLGVVSKAFNTHSTVEEVQTATTVKAVTDAQAAQVAAVEKETVNAKGKL